MEENWVDVLMNLELLDEKLEEMEKELENSNNK